MCACATKPPVTKWQRQATRRLLKASSLPLADARGSVRSVGVFFSILLVRLTTYSLKKTEEYHSGQQKCSVASVISKMLIVLSLVSGVGLYQPVLAAGIGADKTGTVKKGPSEPRNPGDAQIERNLKARLAKSKLSADHFSYSVSQGAVTIEGTTNVMQHKGVMTRMAKASGATAVHNNIRISDAAKAKAVATLAKGRNTTQSAISDAAISPAPSGARSAPTLAPAAAPIPRATVLAPGSMH